MNIDKRHGHIQGQYYRTLYSQRSSLHPFQVENVRHGKQPRATIFAVNHQTRVFYRVPKTFRGYSHVDDLQLVTILECWRQNLDLGDIIWMLVPDAHIKR